MARLPKLRRRDAGAGGRRRLAVIARAAGALLVLAALCLVLAGGGGDVPAVQEFESEPELEPATLSVTAGSDSGAGGHVFLAPHSGEQQNGAMIVDSEGELIWFHPAAEGEAIMDFRPQEYEGEQVLTWWEGEVFTGYGDGEFVIADSSYNEIARFEAGNGRPGDLHELLLTPQGTALINIYQRQDQDLSAVGGPEDGAVLESIVQEIDVESGRVLFEWESLDHVALEESYEPLPKDPEAPYDHFHVNSVGVDNDGNLLVSGRHPSAIYKIDREDGEIIWRLGGKESDFEMGEGTRFTAQHDVRRQPDGTLTLFDNATPPPMREESRGMVLDLDEEAMTATLVREYERPGGPLAESQGNAQFTPEGVLVGWGSQPYVSAFTAGGELVFDAELATGESYRAYRSDWTGRPTSDPAMSIEGEGNDVTVHASWNGATEVESWEVLAGSDAAGLEGIATAENEGFETTIELETEEPFIAVRALDAGGEALATSRPAPLAP